MHANNITNNVLNTFLLTPSVPSFILNVSNQLVTGSCTHDTAV